MPTTPQQLITEAKRLEKLSARRRKLRKELKVVEAEMKLVKRHLKALASSSMDPDDQLPTRWKGKVE